MPGRPFRSIPLRVVHFVHPPPHCRFVRSPRAARGQPRPRRAASAASPARDARGDRTSGPRLTRRPGPHRAAVGWLACRHQACRSLASPSFRVEGRGDQAGAVQWRGSGIPAFRVAQESLHQRAPPRPRGAASTKSPCASPARTRRVEVRDDGVGLPPRRAGATWGSSGCASAPGRLGGALSVEPAGGGGTRDALPAADAGARRDPASSSPTTTRSCSRPHRALRRVRRHRRGGHRHQRPPDPRVIDPGRPR